MRHCHRILGYGVLCLQMQVGELLTKGVDKINKCVASVRDLRIVLDVLITYVLRHSQFWLALVERDVEKFGGNRLQVVGTHGLPFAVWRFLASRALRISLAALPRCRGDAVSVP